MNRNVITWIAAGILALGLAALSVDFGLTLLPTKEIATEKGTVVPWFLTWGMVWIATAIGVTIAGFLFSAAMKEGRRPAR